MTRRNSKMEQVNIYDDFSKYIRPKEENPELKEKRFTMIMPQGMYDNIAKLAKNEGMGTVTYIRDILIAPQLQEIANRLKAEYDRETKNDSTENKSD